MKKILYITTLLVLTVSCNSKQKKYTIKSMKGEYVPVVTTNNPDAEMQELVTSFKTELDKEMGKIIGHTPHDMTTARPESMLTNLTSDWMKILDKKHTGGKTIDLAFMNVRGIRAPIAKGEITMGAIFDAFPFDNSLDIVELEGKYLTEVFESYAKMGGAGVSGNVKLVVRETELVSALINGEKVDANKVYTIVTLDYLAEGNDGMDGMKNAKSITETGIKLRDYMLEMVKATEAKKQQVITKLDGRITITE